MDLAVHEYLTVRGVIGECGIACSVLLRSTISDDLDMEDTRRRIADSLTLLGLRPDSLQADSDPHLRASPALREMSNAAPSFAGPVTIAGAIRPSQARHWVGVRC